MNKTLKAIAALVITTSFVSIPAIVPAMACTYVIDDDATKQQMVSALAAEVEDGLTMEDLAAFDLAYFERGFTRNELCPERTTSTALVSIMWIQKSLEDNSGRFMCQAVGHVTEIDEWTGLKDRVIVKVATNQCVAIESDWNPILTTPPIDNGVL